VARTLGTLATTFVEARFLCRGKPRAHGGQLGRVYDSLLC